MQDAFSGALWRIKDEIQLDDGWRWWGVVGVVKPIYMYKEFHYILK
jgi:hypothetical protein